jgi:hypothetical protein
MTDTPTPAMDPMATTVALARAIVDSRSQVDIFKLLRAFAEEIEARCVAKCRPGEGWGGLDPRCAPPFTSDQAVDIAAPLEAASCRIVEYDGAFKCLTHKRQWGALPRVDEPCIGATAPPQPTTPCTECGGESNPTSGQN